MQPPAQPGASAPEFAVPAIHTDGMISLADYGGSTARLRGSGPRGDGPWCGRALAQMAVTSEKLKPLGVACVAVVGTELENARLYYSFRPTRLTMGADPRLTTHQSYGVPRPDPTPELLEAIENIRINPTGELPEPLPVQVAAMTLNEKDRHQFTETDLREGASTYTQMKGHFLIDRGGVIRWSNIECEKEGLAGIGGFPSHNEMMAAARLVT